MRDALGLTASHTFTVALTVCPATSCKALLAASPGTASGVYTLDPDGTGGAEPFSAWCDMTGNGGGWTLAAMTRSSGSVLGYNSVHWTSATVFNTWETNPDTDAAMKNMAFNTAAFTSIRFCLGSRTNCLVNNTAATSALALFSGPYVNTNISRATFMSWDPTNDQVFNSQPYCNLSGYNARAGSSISCQCRFGLIMNNENDCGTPDATIGFGCSRSYDGASIGAGSLSFEPWAVYPQRGWLYIR